MTGRIDMIDTLYLSLELTRIIRQTNLVITGDDKVLNQLVLRISNLIILGILLAGGIERKFVNGHILIVERIEPE